MTLTPGLDYLGRLTNYEATGSLPPPSLDRMEVLSRALGSPGSALDVVHLTGTNGKGSTAAFVAALLARSGRQVGLYTSPHLREVNERVRINGVPATDEVLDAALKRVAAAARQAEVQPTWFEALTLAALLVFADEGVDAAVIEVGMLGRWDATNVVDARVAVITNVELDHVDEAGGGRRAIASEKAGIVKPGSTLVLGEVDPSLTELFLAGAPATVHLRNRDFRGINGRGVEPFRTYELHTPTTTYAGVRIGMSGRHQADNAALALTAAEALLGRPVTDEVVRSVLAEVAVPGRFEQISAHPSVYLDGAHNPAAGQVLRRLVRTVPRTGPRVLVVGALAGRDHEKFLDAVGIDDYDVIVCTEPPSPRVLRAAELAAALEPTISTVITEPDVARAGHIAVLAAGPDGVVVVTGSLYLLDGVRRSVRDVVRRTDTEWEVMA